MKKIIPRQVFELFSFKHSIAAGKAQLLKLQVSTSDRQKPTSESIRFCKTR